MSYTAGVFSINTVGQPVVTGTVISSSTFNALTSDIATGLSTAMLKDGTQVITANIPMAGFKITGLGAATAAGQAEALVVLSAVAGTNTVTATANPVPSAYAVGQTFSLTPAVTNTGATTLNISGLGAGAVQLGGAALSGGELAASFPVSVIVSAVTPVFQILAPLAQRGSFTATLTGCTAVITGTAVYSVTNNIVTLYLPALSGTSNSTAATITGLPAAIQPVTAHNGLGFQASDNGNALTTPARADVSGGTITLYKDFAAGNWTAANAKGLTLGATLTYGIN